MMSLYYLSIISLAEILGENLPIYAPTVLKFKLLEILEA